MKKAEPGVRLEVGTVGGGRVWFESFTAVTFIIEKLTSFGHLDRRQPDWAFNGATPVDIGDLGDFLRRKDPGRDRQNEVRCYAIVWHSPGGRPSV